MKLAVAIAETHASGTAFVVWRGFEDSIRKAAEFGYHGVELALKSADEIKASKLENWLSKYNMEVSCINTGQVFATRGLYFTHPEAKVRNEVIEVFSEFILLAKDFGKMVNIGRVRGFIADHQSRQETELLFSNTIEKIAESAEKHGVTLVIEPVNRYELNFINSVEEGARLLKSNAMNNIGLMPDLFHMNIEDAHIGESLARWGSLIHYIHFADSNRHAPGQGHLDFDEAFRGLEQAGFNGWSAIEILPVPDPDTAARQAADFILPRIEKYNRAQNCS